MSTPIIDIKVDMRNVQRLLQNVPKAMPKVISRSINKTVTPVRTYMVRQLIKPVNAEMKAVRASQRKAGKHTLGYYKKVPSTKFKIKDIKKNIKTQKATYKVWRASIWIKRFKGQEAVESKQPSFVARMKSGKVSIFKRLGAARIPIADQLRRLMRVHFRGIKGQVKREAKQRLKRNVDSQIKLALGKWKTGAKKAG